MSKIQRVLVINLFFAFLVIGNWLTIHSFETTDVVMYVQYGEYHANMDGGTSQLFCADANGVFSEEHSRMCNINENGMYVEFQLPDLDFASMRLRLDPFMNREDFSISCVYVVYDGKLLRTMPEGEFVQYIEAVENCEYTLVEGRYMYTSSTGDPILYLSNEFNEKIITTWEEDIVVPKEQMLLWCVILFVWFEIGLLLFARYRENQQIRMSKAHLVAVIVADVLLMLGGILSYGVRYLVKNFGDVRVEELLFNMKMPLQGTNMSSFDTLFRAFGIIAAVATIFVFGVDVLARKLQWKKGYAGWISMLGVIGSIYALVIVSGHFDLVGYWNFIHEETTIYEEEYVKGENVAISFPEDKRNLIYIYLESMETTYASADVGGAMKENYIPELTELAQENIDFSAEGQLNGAHTLSGTTFTTAAIVSHTSGTPINTSLVDSATVNMWQYGEDSILPEVWTLGDVLEQEGYAQTFLIGSNGVFGGRTAYMNEHGSYTVKDYYTAIETGKIPDGYYVWWGYEDAKLFEYAKEELLSLSAEEAPFNFTMLTVDTHFTDGYLCENCGNAFGDQYSNVIACSSSMVAEFVDWIKQQEFYENTTIVIAGDHLTMDSYYIENKGADDFDRRAYFTIINPAEGCAEAETERSYTTFDICPTTLTALGAQIEGNKMGFGVNLFSEEQTLYEKYGEEYLNEELLKYSDFYLSELM